MFPVRAGGPDEPRIPNLFLVGVQRSATTALWTYLGQHPEIFMAPKELHYFGRDLGVHPEKVNRGERPDLTQYLAYFDKASDERYRGDASVGYLYSATAAAEIHEFSPEAKIVASFRNPVDMVYSLYSLLKFQGAEKSPSLADALADTGPRWAFTSWPFRWAFTYREVVNYAVQLQRFLDAFGPERVHVVIYEDFVADPAATYGKVLRFLNVDDSFLPAFPVVNANRKIRSRRLQRWLYSPPTILRRGGKMVVPAKPARRELGKRLIDHNRREVARPEIDPGLRQVLEVEFAPEVVKLGEMIGRDLGAIWWRSGTLAAN